MPSEHCIFSTKKRKREFHHSSWISIFWLTAHRIDSIALSFNAGAIRKFALHSRLLFSSNQMGLFIWLANICTLHIIIVFVFSESILYANNFFLSVFIVCFCCCLFLQLSFTCIGTFSSVSRSHKQNFFFWLRDQSSVALSSLKRGLRSDLIANDNFLRKNLVCVDLYQQFSFFFHPIPWSICFNMLIQIFMFGVAIKAKFNFLFFCSLVPCYGYKNPTECKWMNNFCSDRCNLHIIETHRFNI